MTELLLALWGNVRELFVGATLVALCGAGLAALLWGLESGDCGDEQMLDTCRKVMRRCALVALVCGPLACIPTIDDLWRVRISLLKYQLAAPENVQAATETIERIGKKLECKYLGGCEEVKP